MILKPLLLILLACSSLFAQQIVLQSIVTPQGLPRRISFNEHGEMYAYDCLAKDVVVLDAQGGALGTLPKSCEIAFGADRFAVVCGAHDKRYIYQDYKLPSPTSSYTIDPLYDTPDSSFMTLSLTPQAVALVNDQNEIFVYYPINGMDEQTGQVVRNGTILKKYSSTGVLLLRKKFEGSLGYLYKAIWEENKLRLRFESQIYTLDGQLNVLSHVDSPIDPNKYGNMIELAQGGWLGVGVQQDSLFWLDPQANVKATISLSDPSDYKLIFQNRAGSIYLRGNNAPQLSKVILEETVTLATDFSKEQTYISKIETGYKCAEGIVEVQVFDLTGRQERHHGSQFNTLLKGKLIMIAIDASGNVHRQCFMGF